MIAMKAFLKRLAVGGFLFLAFYSFSTCVEFLAVRIGRAWELAIIGAALALWLRYSKRVFALVEGRGDSR